MEQRRNQIVELVNRKGSISFAQLKEAFPSVSEMTLRTDLKALDEARRVVRVHGGVKSVEQVVGTDDLLSRRSARNAEAKQLIAEKAAALLRPNTTLFLDSGSTTTAVARCIPDQPMLIYTSGLSCAMELAKLEKPHVSLPGGSLNRFSMSVCGTQSVQTLEVIAWPDLGCEAVRRLTVKDMPLTVILDAHGGDLYQSGPAAYLASEK